MRNKLKTVQPYIYIYIGIDTNLEENLPDDDFDFW